MILRRSFVFLSLLFLFAARVAATHIVGAELYYDCLNASSNSYKIKLRMLRDCINGQAPFDDPISVFIFQSSNSSAPPRIYDIPIPPLTPRIPTVGWDSCTFTPPNVCVEEAIYEFSVTLPPITGGYDIGWARCCRNFNIDNLLTPLCEGVSFLAHIPGPEHAVCNNMAQFRNLLPTFICAGETFVFDHSATDADGDSLVYSLEWPYTGLNFNFVGAGNNNPSNNCFGIQPGPIVESTNPMGPPPYRNVVYQSGQFSPGNPFGPNSATIDPQTGLLTFTPPNIGTWVVAIAVKEYRNGVLLAENRRDLQITTIACRPQNTPPVITHDLSTTPHNGDTIIIDALDPFCYTAEVLDTNLQDNLITQAISPIFSAGDGPSVSISGTNPMLATICWTPACNRIGQLFPLILQAHDIHNCPGTNYAFDTVWVRITAPPPALPGVVFDLNLSPHTGDTILASLNGSFCFEWEVWDSTGSNNPISYTSSLEDLSGNPGTPPTTTILYNSADTVRLSSCWTPTCNDVGRLYRVILRGTDQGACPPQNTDTDTLYIRVAVPPNPPPTVSHDLSGNPLSGDTLIWTVAQNGCYTFAVNDTFPALNLSFQVQVIPLDGGITGTPAPVTQVIGTQDSLQVRLCWIPGCTQSDRSFLIVTQGVQENACQRTALSLDSVYVRVQNVPQPPPLVGHGFLPGFQVSGDTIFVDADSAACFTFFVQDTAPPARMNYAVTATETRTGTDVSRAQQFTLTTLTDSLIEGQVCIIPGCDLADQTLRIVITGMDSLDCDTNHIVRDTLYIHADTPPNNPPYFQTNLGGLNVIGGVIHQTPEGREYCFELTLTDPDPNAAQLIAAGASEIFDPYFNYGNPATTTVTGTNPLTIRVCWNPSCYDDEQEFVLKICGRDTSRCGLTPEVCDSVRFYVDPCSLDNPNIITPNGDGFNDVFMPFTVKGVEYFRMEIYDRWGRKLFDAQNQAWDGTLNGNAVPDGVYYYILEYRFWSARGVPLDDKKVGTVTLLR